ncbi:MAG: right-handed parallel beta-helix repeat-containing protein [Pirellulales bacterium]
MNAAGISPSSIVFQISGSKVINLQSELPAIQRSVSINSANVPGIVLDGSNAGFGSGLTFIESTVQISNVVGLQIREFSVYGIDIRPSNTNERVNVSNCFVHSNGLDGVNISGGRLHTISSDSVIQNNGQFGVSVNSTAVSGVTVTASALQLNTLGGVKLLGNGHEISNCSIISNGQTESAGQHNGGVVFGSGASSATNCRAEFCTLADNAPYGAKVVIGSGNEVRENETYLNASLGIETLPVAQQPPPTLFFFVVDENNDMVFIAGSASGTANSQVEIEFFVAFESTNQGAVFTSKKSVTLNASGFASFHHTFDRDQVFEAEAISPTPIPFTIDNADRLVATATNTNGNRGTSEFSARSFPTLPGDFDLDGDVDSGDYTIWRDHKTATNAIYTWGDADFDTVVDDADYAIWAANFGQTP